MGDVSAAIGIIQRMGFGKGERHEHKFSYGPKRKKRHVNLQYHDVNGSDSQQPECKSGREEVSDGSGEQVQITWENKRLDTNGLEQQDVQDHTQGRTDLGRCCIQSDC